MKRLTTRGALGVMVVSTLAGLALLAFFITVAGGGTAKAATVTIGIDGDISGNTASAVPSVEECANGGIGQQFQVDLYIKDVTNIIAFQTCIVYDPAVVSVVSADVGWLLDGPGSNVQNYSGPTTYSNVYRVQAVDIAGPPPPVHSGSGVLARLTLQGVAGGVSPAKIIPTGFTWCPLTLTDTNGQQISATVTQAHIGAGRPDLCSPTVDTDHDGTANLSDVDDDNDDFDDNKEAFLGTDPLGSCSAVRTTLSLPASPGSTSITVASATGFEIGDWITLNPQGANQEMKAIGGIAGNVISLASSLTKAHSAGERVYTPVSDYAAWPPDMNNDTWVTILDLTRVTSHMFTCINGYPNYGTRYDLNTDLCMSILDIMKLRPYMFTGCVNR